MFSMSPEDYDFQAQTTADKRIDLKHVFGMSIKRATNYKINVLYDMQFVIHRVDLPTGMREWLESLITNLDLDSQKQGQIIEDALRAVRAANRDTVHSHDSAEMYD